jgi:hypothetical protein
MTTVPEVTLHSRKFYKFYVYGLAMAFPSLLVGLDLYLSFRCTRVPLSWYLGACAIGAVVGPLLGRKLHGDGFFRGLLRRLIVIAVVVGTIGAASMTACTPAKDGFSIFPPSWNTKCAYRYCGRVLGPSLSRSPFPVGTPPSDP